MSSTRNCDSLNVKDILKVLHPKRYASFHENPNDCKNKQQRRFSTLLLEHGEQELQDWGVVASSSRVRESASSGSGSQSNADDQVNISLSSSSNTAGMGMGIGMSSSFASSVLYSSSSSKLASSLRAADSHSHSDPPYSKARKEREPGTNMKSIQGRLHLCSKSIIFEPHDISRGIIRISFDKMTISPNTNTNTSTNANTNASTNANSNRNENTNSAENESNRSTYTCRTIHLETNRCLIMKKNNIIAPYETIDKRVSFSFTFQHSTAEPFQELFEKIYNDNVSDEKQLEEIVRPMCDRPFDPLNFVHLKDVPLTSNLRAFILGPFPLVKKAGCVIVTKERLYFQPFQGVFVDSEIAARALSWCMKDIVAIARRYHGLKDEAVELFFQEGPSVLLAFEGYKNREEVLGLIPQKRTMGTSTGMVDGIHMDVNVEGCGSSPSPNPVDIPVFCHTDRSFLNMVVTAWRSGNIDNFDYLLALNSAAGRSLFDLSRYPIFPWVLADYESSKLDLSSSGDKSGIDSGNGNAGSANKQFRDLTKPIGALNEERLESFKDRWKGMEGMGGDAFLYGTHYSAPGYCLYYLVRTMPEQMLCLQNGKYDAPDRLFHSINQCYASILSNPADVKESIPQFYDPKAGVDILLNLRGLQLGITQTGTIIDDVKLPKWAKSPKDFLKKNRKALESDYCTNYLPSWIDLIFGAKARGEKALNADNLFHPTAYLSPKDLEEMETEQEKMQAELQATEFGICPDVLFSSLHPRKTDENVSNSAFIAPDDGRALRREESDVVKKQDEGWERVSRVLNYAQPDPKAVRMKSAGQEGDDEANKDISIDEETIQVDANDFRVENDAASALDSSDILLSGSGVSSSRLEDTISGIRTFGSSEDKETNKAPPQRTPPLSSGTAETEEGWKLKPVISKQIHGGAVSGCHLSLGTSSYVTTTSLDGGLMVHGLPSAQGNDPKRRSFTSAHRLGRHPIPQKADSNVQQHKFHPFRSHHSSDPLACLAHVSDGKGGNIAFAGGHDDVILAYGINSACALASVYSHRDAVTGLVLVSHPKSDDGQFTHIMISSSWDATVKLWNVCLSGGESVKISKEPFDELFDADSAVDCVDALHIAGVGLAVAAGGTDGSLIVWLWTVDGEKTVLFQKEAKRGHEPCSSVKWSNNGEILLVAGFGNGQVSSFAFKHDGMYPVSKLNLGSPVQCLCIIPSGQELFAGCADGGIRLISVADGGHFDDHKPKSWGAVNGESSPGVTSLCVVPSEGERKIYTIASGAEDGSLALFLIEKL